MGPLVGAAGGIVDAHVHFWNPRTTPWASNRMSRAYRYLPGPVGDWAFSAAVGQADREFALTPRNVARPYEPTDYAADSAGVHAEIGERISGVVFIESHWRAEGQMGVAEARYAADLPFGQGRAPQLVAYIAHGDPRYRNLSAQLDLIERMVPQFRGIRLIGARHPDPKVRDWIDVDSVLTGRDFLSGFDIVASRDVVFETFVYSHQLRDVGVVAREYPDTTIVVDHLGAPIGVFGPVGARTGATAAARADILAVWKERTAALSQHPNVVMKLSGLAFPILGYGRLASGNIGGRATLGEMIAPLVDHLVSHFGAERLMFGSNFPIDKPNASCADIVVALAGTLEKHGPHVVRMVFSDNARRIYRVGAS